MTDLATIPLICIASPLLHGSVLVHKQPIYSLQMSHSSVIITIRMTSPQSLLSMTPLLKVTFAAVELCSISLVIKLSWGHITQFSWPIWEQFEVRAIPESSTIQSSSQADGSRICNARKIHLSFSTSSQLPGSRLIQTSYFIRVSVS